ncbi:MAG: hypothetical protein KIS91_16055 [Anaerolineae bacterium]|nr:hypothetical protein [Anaerolineae bacterium]
MTIDPSNVTAFAFALAFAAGLVSFLSPCVLPLVPAYLSYLGAAAIGPGGMAVSGGGVAIAARRNVFVNAVFFVLGFSLIFIALGATIGVVGFVFQDLVTGLMRAGAALLIVFGLRVASARLRVSQWVLVGILAAVALYVIKVGFPLTLDVRGVLDSLMVFLIVMAAIEMPAPFRLPLSVGAALLNVFGSPFGPLGPRGMAALTGEPVRLIALLLETGLIFAIVMFLSQSDVFYMEKRLEFHTGERRGVWNAMLMGAIFGAGWTPCVGPNLAAIFTLGSQSQTALLASLLLAVYSLGLGIPFLAMALAFDRFVRWMQQIKRHMSTVTAINGALLVLIALLLLSGRLALLAQLQTPWSTVL